MTGETFKQELDKKIDAAVDKAVENADQSRERESCQKNLISFVVL